MALARDAHEDNPTAPTLQEVIDETEGVEEVEDEALAFDTSKPSSEPVQTVRPRPEIRHSELTPTLQHTTLPSTASAKSPPSPPGPCQPTNPPAAPTPSSPQTRTHSGNPTARNRTC